MVATKDALFQLHALSWVRFSLHADAGRRRATAHSLLQSLYSLMGPRSPAPSVPATPRGVRSAAPPVPTTPRGSVKPPLTVEERKAQANTALELLDKFGGGFMS